MRQESCENRFLFFLLFVARCYLAAPAFRRLCLRQRDFAGPGTPDCGDTYDSQRAERDRLPGKIRKITGDQLVCGLLANRMGCVTGLVKIT